MAALDPATFEAPGPGRWTADGLHGPRPFSAIGAHSFGPPIERGMAIGGLRYGHLVENQFRFVNRFMYGRRIPVLARPPGDDETARTHFEAMAAANPIVAESFRRAEETIETRRWEQDLEDWDHHWKPWLMGRTLDLTDVDPAALDHDALATHLDETIYHSDRAMELHHVLNMVMGVPVQTLIFNVVRWGIADMSSAPALLKGASPVSIGLEPELRSMVAALQAEPAAAALVDGPGDPADRLEQLRTYDGAVGEAARAWLRLVGIRTIGGWDAMDRYALEEPAGLLSTLRSALEGERPGVDLEFVASVRDQVREDRRPDFDRMYEEARRFARVRDERDVYCNLPATGLIRRAVLEIGRRLHASGRVDDREHATEASVSELKGLLAGEAPVTAAVLSDRYSYRMTYTINDIPQSLGEPEQPDVPYEWLPLPVRLLTAPPAPPPARAEEAAGTDLKGTTAQPGTYEGPVRIVLGPNDFGKLEQGDVLVTTGTNPAFSVILPLLGAIVTDHGGPLCHAAIIAREYGLPAVVGCGAATATLHDGDRVRVDATNATVQRLA